MAIYTSNTNRVTGLSGIDTESMIDQMMKAESAKYNRLEKEKTSITWKQEAYRNLITAIQDFQNKWYSTGSLSNNIGYDAFWNNYTAEITDATTGAVSNAISIKNITNSGKYEINVTQKAETESITGKEVVSGISTNKTLVEIGADIEKYGSISLSVNMDGTAKEITISASELTFVKDSNGNQDNNLDEVLQQKLNGAFGNDQITVERNANGNISFKLEEAGHSLTISDGAERAGASITVAGALATDTTDYTININGEDVTVTFSDPKASSEQKLKEIQEALENKTDSTGKKLSEYVTLSTNSNGDLEIKNTSKTDGVTVNGTTLNPTGSVDLMGITKTTNNVNLSTKLSTVAGAAFDDLFVGPTGDEITLNFGGKNVTINKDDTIQSLINKVNASEGSVKLSFNEVTNRFNIESTESGARGSINIDDEDTKNFLLNITKINLSNKKDNDKYVEGQDAIFKIDGIETSRPSNEISMNGIKFTINSTGKVNLNAQNDIDATVEKIKSFVEDYNKLIDQINTAVSTNRVKSDTGYYEPLTDEEKKDLSEDEIKKWEEAAKKGLLYRDEGLTRFLSDLRKNIYNSVDIGGKTISLYEIGITTTSNYNDGGKLEINEDKLRKALQERGDEVKQLFTAENGVANVIKKEIDNAIGTKGYLRQKAGIVGTTSSANNDLTKELEDITKKLKEERERLANKESYYFNMFAKMEAAMNQQNNQMSVLLSSFGG